MAAFLTAPYSAGNSSKNLAALGLYSLCPVAIIGEQSNSYRIISTLFFGSLKMAKKGKNSKVGRLQKYSPISSTCMSTWEFKKEFKKYFRD